jgi:hypothetical protein
VVPDAGSDDTACTGHASHLAEPADRVGHEVDDELRESGVELIVRERQLLRRGQSDVDARVPFGRGGRELSRGIDRGDCFGADAPHELRRQGAGPAADVDDVLARFNAGKVRQLRCEWSRIAAHEAVV